MRDLDKFILDAVDNCSTYEMLGQEIRCLELILLNEYFICKDPIYEFLITLIDKYQSDKELGFYVNKVRDKIENYLTN